VLVASGNAAEQLRKLNAGGKSWNEKLIEISLFKEVCLLQSNFPIINGHPHSSSVINCWLLTHYRLLFHFIRASLCYQRFPAGTAVQE